MVKIIPLSIEDKKVNMEVNTISISIEIDSLGLIVSMYKLVVIHMN